MENMTIKDSELDFYINLLYTNNQALKKMEENQKKLKNIIINKLDILKTKKYSISDNTNVNDTENKSKPLSVILVENTKVNFDIDKVRKIVPEALEKTLTVNKQNLIDFKNALKDFGLTGKQVNELVKIMNIKISVNEDEISSKLDKGEIDSKQLAEISHINTVSRYIKFI